MLHLIPAPLHRAALRVAHGVRKRWWRVRRPRLRGCRVVALDPHGRVLLVRHSYGNRRWFLPGGGIDRGEEPLAAAVRELREETGCRLDQPRLLDVLEQTLSGAANQVHVVSGRTSDAPRADTREIVAAEFFAVEALPQPMGEALEQQIRAWVTAAATDAGGSSHAAPPPPAPTA